MTIEHSFFVSEEDAGMRLDKLLSLSFPQYSRTYFQYLIEQGCVLVNGSSLKKREKLSPGDEVEICFLLTPEISLEPENIPLEILYEDEYLLAVNKPAGMVIHPAPGHHTNTFVHALLFHCQGLEVLEDPLRPGIVHRLDKDTSGVLLAAKTQGAHQALVSLFCNRKIDKRYLAICVGNPGNITIDAPIQRHPVHRKEMTVGEGGKHAVSHIEVLKYNPHLSFIEVRPITGRTHQIRVHLKHNKTPVLGDPIYGSPSMNQKYATMRQMLHAHQICFTHPITKVSLSITAPIPEDMKILLEKNLG